MNRPSAAPAPPAAYTAPPSRPSILDLSREELARELVGRAEPAFRARQVWRALHRGAHTAFGEMTDVSKSLRADLSQSFSIDPLQAALTLKSRDGSTDKWLFRLPDGELIETVLMRYDPDGHRRGRRTVCISTQAGCALGCTFCATGQQGLARNLTSGEIVAQVLHAVRAVRAERLASNQTPGTSGVTSSVANLVTNPNTNPITNIVFMGMGEPLANYDATMAAVRALNDPDGVAVGARHITVSTVGLAPQILRLAAEPLQINLAVSLHAADDETRSETMPVNRRYPIRTLMGACWEYVAQTKRRIFFEYVLLRGQNDSAEHATRLAGLLRGLLCHVNLIPVNVTAAGPYRRPGARRVRAFQEVLRDGGTPSTVRSEKGIDIDAGCGQLRARALGLSPRVQS